MMKSSIISKFFVLILMILGLLILGACTLLNPSMVPTHTPASTTTLPSTSTLTPTGTATLSPQPTLTATSLPITPMPAGPRLKDLPVISFENAVSLKPLVSVELNEGDQVTWSPTGNAFAVSAPSGMKVYRLDSFSNPISIRYQSQPYFSSDGTYIAIRLESGIIQVWDMEQGDLYGEYHGLMGDIVYMSFSPGNDLLAAVSINNQLLVWDLTSGEMRAALKVPEYVIPVTYTYDLLFSPDLSQLALFRESEALLWEIDGSLKPYRLYWKPAPASPAHGPYQFSPDWAFLAWSDRGSIMVMDTSSEEPMNEFERQVGAPFSFTQDWGSLVVIGYNDTAISVWDPLSAELLQLLEHPQTVFQFQLSPDERYLASLTFEGRVTLWDMTTGVAMAELTNDKILGDWLAFSPQGDRLALLLSDGHISMWDVTGVTEIFTIDNQAIGTFLFSPDGSLLVTVSPLGGLEIWDAPTCTQITAVDMQLTSMDLNPFFVYGGRLLDVEVGGELQLWGVDTNTEAP